MKKLVITLTVLTVMILGCFSASATSDQLLAFPGAVGGAKYSPGARGELENGGTIEVYHVTNLNSSGVGSFADAISKSGRIIVFDVGGTIETGDDITIKNSNITILGQTAPGDGITISGGSLLTGDGVENVVIRYLRVRPTDKNGGEPDGIGGRFGSNIMIDHCSASWCVDELLTLYAGPAQGGATVGNHLTIQNTIGSESLRMSNHVKGAHGYGAIWGGTYATYAYNLLAHHDSRSPRLDRQLQGTEVSNNVIYNWGQTNSAYGAEPYSSDYSMRNPSIVNWVANYYKYGPSTRESLRYRIFDVTGPYESGDAMSQFYFSGNYVTGSTSITEDNSTGVNNVANAELLVSEVDMGEYAFDKMTAEEAYEYVLSNSGATLPKRDAVDARIVNDVKYGTGRVINNASEVGGLIDNEETYEVFEIPAEWLTQNGYSGMSETDIISDGGENDGYTVIEAYVNEWTEEQSAIEPTNPEIVVQSPGTASLNSEIKGLSVDNGNWTVISEGESVDYKATGFAVGGNEVVTMELYDKNTLIGTFDGSAIDTSIYLDAGTHYLTCRATNSIGEKTQSTTAIVYVKKTAEPGSFETAEIGSVTYSGKGGASMDESGVYTIYGSGRITSGKSSDACEFMYKEISGDFDVIVRTNDIPKFENQQVSGIMVRSSLDAKSAMAMVGDGWLKYGETVRVFSRASYGAKSVETFFQNTNGDLIDNSSDDDTHTAALPKFMRIQREGNTLTFSVSNTGTDWTDNDRQPFSITYDSLPDVMYVGLATDSASGVSVKEYFSIASFSHLSINGESDVVVDDMAVPFHDTDFDGSGWYNESGSIVDCSSSPLNGYYGDALQFWLSASRSFNAQNEGIVTSSTDFCMTGGKAQVDANNGAHFMLNGINSDGETTKIASIYAQHAYGFFAEYDDDDDDPNTLPAAIPNVDPTSTNKPEFNVWYKVETTLNYITGKGSFSFIPYTEYNSADEVYELGESIFDYEFDFDTSIAFNMLHYQRFGGWEMYLANVSVDVYIPEVLYIEDGKVVVDMPSTDAVLYIAEYDARGALVDVSEYSISADETTSYDIPSGGKTAKAFLWGGDQYPLCDAVQLY